MRRGFIYILMILSIPALLFADTTRVLFIGNSYTYVNDLPGMFKSLSISLGKAVYTDMSAPGGYSLEQHLSNPETQLKISSGNWNFVILQEQSQMPAIEYYRYNFTYPSARRLDSIIKSHNSGTMFFMTWGRRYGGIQCIDTSCSPPFVNFSHMQDTISSAYRMIANELNASLCQVGNVWKQSVNTDSSVILWDADLSHPSLAGTYLSACSFYTKIFHSSPIGSEYNAGLPYATALYLQTIASNYVLNITKEGLIEKRDFILHQNYPNPFNSSTVISFEVNRRTRADLKIYNTEGRLVENVFTGFVNQGKHKIYWTAKSSLPSGIYFITLSNGKQTNSGKLIYIK
jgi:hypothetical protein